MVKLELKQRGIDISLYPDSLIEYSPNAGSDFLKFLSQAEALCRVRIEAGFIFVTP